MAKDVKSLLYRMVFTLTPPIDSIESDLVEMLPELERVLISLKCKKYSFQLERGAEAQRLHYQGRFSLLNKTSIEVMLRKLTLTGITRGWQLHLDKEWSKESTSTLYTKKSETSIPGTFMSSDKLFSSAYKGGDLYLIKEKYKDEYLWQQQLEDHLNTPLGKYNPAAGIFPTAGHRLIDILSDPKGNYGKSVFIKRFLYNNGKRVFYVPVVDNPTQILSSFISFIEGNFGEGPDVILIDIPRAIDFGSPQGANNTIVKIHNIAEILRSGLITTSMYGKYKCALVVPPRVLIMTNYTYNGVNDYLWCPSNRFVIMSLQKDGSSIYIPELI
jgi:hypothetical protein